MRQVKGRGEDTDAQALNERGCMEAVTTGERQKELVEGQAPENVVTTEESRGSPGDLADDIVARGGAVQLIELIEFRYAKRDEAERGLHALRAIGFAKQHGDQVGAIVGIGEHGCRVHRLGLETI